MEEARQQARGSMWGIWILAVIAWSLVPYKAWSRAILGFEGFNFGDVVLVILAVPFVFNVFRERKSDQVSFWISLIWMIIAISFVKGVFEGEDIRELSRVVRAALLWSIVPMMKATIRNNEQLQRWIRGMVILLIIASSSVVMFSLYPSLIPANDEVALAREEYYGGFQRIFTLGMWGMFPAAVLALGSLVLTKEKRLASFFFFLTLLVGLIFTFTRTFFWGIIVAVALYTIKDWKKIVKGFLIPAIFLGSMFVVVGSPTAVSDLVSATYERTIKILTVDISDIDPTDVSGYGTLVWRLNEIAGVTSNMVTNVDIFLGVLGRTYTLPEGEPTSVPHISYLGIYYCHGLLGVAVYAGFLISVSRRLWQNQRQASGHRLSWILTSAFASWICLLFGALTAPLFQFPFGTASLAFVVGISESVIAIVKSERGLEG